MGDERRNSTIQQGNNEGQSHKTDEQSVPEQRYDARLADITADICRLEDAAAEAKRPWYQKAPVLISLAAVLVSASLTVITTGMEQRRVAHQERGQQIERLQQTVLELHKLSNALTLELSTNQNPQIQSNAGSFLMAQQQLLGEEAFGLVNQLGVDTVSSSQLSSIGYQLAQGMELQKAEQLYKAVVARGSSKKTNARRAALAGLGEIYMAPAAKRFDRFDPVKGGASWKSLLDDIGGGDDNVSLYLRADALIRWAGAEFNAGLADDPSNPSEAATEQGRKLLARAEVLASRLMINDRNRDILLMRLKTVEVTLGTNDIDSFAYDSVIPGVSQLRFLNHPARRTDCVLTAGANSLNFQIHVTEYGEDGRVGANLTGMLNLLDPTTAQLQWQRTGHTGNPMQPLGITQGQTILHRVGTEARYRGLRPDLITGGTTEVEYYFPAYATMMGSKVAISSPGVADEPAP